MLDLTDTTDSPLSSGDPALQIRLGVAALAAEDRGHWTGVTKSQRLRELLEIRERLDAALLRLVGSWDRDRAWEIDGSLSPRAWLEHRTSVSDREAHRLVKNARLVDKHPQIASALADGDITTPHVGAIGRVTSKDREPVLEDHVEMVVEQARRLPVSDFGLVMRRWAVLADDQLAKRDCNEKWDRRHLHASVGLDGWVTGDYYLDPVAGAQVIAALDHIAPPDSEDAPDGPRTLSQRRADALVDIVNRRTKADQPVGNPPNVNAVIDIAWLTGITPDLATAWCDIEGIGPVTRTVLEQLCCDAKFTRFVMAGRSQILEMGRSTRLATSGQRRALAVRDRHCRFPSCRRQPRWCDAHHIAGWAESLGETNLDNLILLCRRHHTLLHNSRWTIIRTADGDFEFTHPARGP